MRAVKIGCILLIALFKLGSKESFAQELTTERTGVILDVPLLDLPFHRLASQTAANYLHHVGAMGNGEKSFGDHLSAFVNPSMTQSLNWSAAWTSLAAFGVNRGVDALISPQTGKANFWSKVIKEMGFAVINTGLMFFPLGDGWLHEEFHRAAMTTNKVHSYNEINSFHVFGEGTVSVVNETDEDLALFK